MKVTPAKDYRKPLYAVGVAAAVLALATTGCTDPKPKPGIDYAGDIQMVSETTEESVMELITDGIVSSN